MSSERGSTWNPLTTNVTLSAKSTILTFGSKTGTFNTIKLAYRNKKTGAIRYEAWYSLELRQLVKSRENLDSGLRVRELIAFKLR